MIATADRFPSGRSREELRLVEVASGLLLLLDAHRLTGRLPLEVQVQASRLRHAVKLAVQAEAARTATLPPTPPPPASRDQAAALRAWIASQSWVQPGPVGWVYLLCFRDPATGEHRPLQGQGCRGQYAGHYWGWTDDLVRRINREHRNPRLARGGPAGPGRPRRRAPVEPARVATKPAGAPGVFGQPGDRVELRFTANGATVANFGLAVTPRVRQGDTWRDGETSFFRVNCWRQLAENVTETLGKGARAIVIGRLRMRSWETDEGERRGVVEVEARRSPPR